VMEQWSVCSKERWKEIERETVMEQLLLVAQLEVLVQRLDISKEELEERELLHIADY